MFDLLMVGMGVYIGWIAPPIARELRTDRLLGAYFAFVFAALVAIDLLPRLGLPGTRSDDSVWILSFSMYAGYLIGYFGKSAWRRRRQVES